MAAPTTLARLLGGAPRLSLGILTADLGRLDDELRRLERAQMVMVHTDVMDGVFCPMLTVGAPFVAAQRTSLLKDVHLMIDEPLDKLGPFVEAGADTVTFQVESASNPHRVLLVLGDAANANDPGRGILRGDRGQPGHPARGPAAAPRRTRLRVAPRDRPRLGRPAVLAVHGGPPRAWT